MPVSSVSIAAAYGLASAGAWGTGDFAGGLATRRANVFSVIAVAHLSSLLPMIFGAWASGEAFPAFGAMLWGGAAGVVGVLALAALYRALSAGPMTIAAPITAVLAAAIPLLYGAIELAPPRPLQLAGFALALVSILLLSLPQGGIGRPKGIGLAIAAGAGFGIFFLVLRQATMDALLWPLVSMRLFSAVFMLGMVKGLRTPLRLPRQVLLFALGSGICDLGGNLLFALAAKTGRLDSASVLASLYPGTTVLLARIFLKERISWVQRVGVAVALAAAIMIAA